MDLDRSGVNRIYALFTYVGQMIVFSKPIYRNFFLYFLNKQNVTTSDRISTENNDLTEREREKTNKI